MAQQKYAVNRHLIETLPAWIKSGEIAIPVFSPVEKYTIKFGLLDENSSHLSTCSAWKKNAHHHWLLPQRDIPAWHRS